MDLIRKRLADPANNEPVRIVIMGGSVTAGRDCDVNPLDLPGTNNRGFATRWCSYPARLEHLLNAVLFSSRRTNRQLDAFPVFEVRNLAVQATNSAIGALVLEHNLVPGLEREPPHIVISSYSANDVHDDEAETFLVNQPAWVRAAHNVRPCDDDLPLVVLADDRFHHGPMLTNALTNTGSIFKTASWYNLMAVMYTNVVRHSADASSNFTGAHPLFGSTRKELTHLGMGFHISQAWTLFFNLLGAMHETCTDSSMPSPFEDKARTLEFVEPPTKYRGPYKWAGAAVQYDWEKNRALKDTFCADSKSSFLAADRPLYSTRSCQYAWMVDPATATCNCDNVKKALDHVMTANDGWESFRYNAVKPVWRTNSTARSTFTIELPNITMDTNTFTMLYLKSYGPDWNGSKVAVSVEVIPPASSSSGRSPARRTRTIDGHHPKEVSVTYPYTIRLPGGTTGDEGAVVGDTIRATFTKIGGVSFMISGMAFCRSSL
jgi:hypothetical protein